MKYIKNLFRLSLVALMVFLISCGDDFLKESPKSFLTTDNAYAKPSDVEQAITGLHVDVRDRYRDDFRLNAQGTDLGYFGEDPARAWDMNDLEYSIDAPWYTTHAWDSFFRLIQKANVAIKGINGIDEDAWESEAQKNAALAEAMFFRALSNRTLVAIFGAIPKVDEAYDYVKTDFVRTPTSEIYKFIEEDLLFATQWLPNPGEEAAPGRITKGAAYHLLSEVYNTMGEFQKAVEAASTVIDDLGYGLMKERFGVNLGNDYFPSGGDVYYDLFVEGNHNLAENKEAIWVIQLEPNVTGGSGYPGERAYGPAYYRMGNTPDGYKAFLGEYLNGKYTGYSDTLGRPVSWVRPTSYLAYDVWKSDWDTDDRNAEHNIKRNFYFDNPESAYHGQKIDWSLYPTEGPNRRTDPLRDTCSYIYPYWMKVASPGAHHNDPGRSGGGWVHKDLYAMRLAETYLLRAEAYIGLGRNDLAASDINQVRTRSHATPVESADVNIDYIFDERARELYTEEWRLVTLMRLNKYVERVRAYNDNPIWPGANIKDHNKLWKIPDDFINLNTDAVIEQNPGYN